MTLYSEHLAAYRDAVEAALPRFLPPEEPAYGVLGRAMAYACEDGGKRLRPVLLLEWAHLCGGAAGQALPFACALEMVHSYSLVHDDLPCMDNSPLRRGKPSVHKAFGEDMALLTGDALLNRAFEVCLAPENRGTLPAGAVLDAAAILADCAGLHGMIGGQAMDLQSEGKTISLAELERLQRGKTAALLRAACRMGAVLGGGDAGQLQAAEAYGTAVGLGFQIVDDILDVTATEQELGKPVGGDRELEKSTYVSLLGLAQARELAAQRTEEALSALQPLGTAAEELRQLTVRLLKRQQ